MRLMMIPQTRSPFPVSSFFFSLLLPGIGYRGGWRIESFLAMMTPTRSSSLTTCTSQPASQPLLYFGGGRVDLMMNCNGSSG